jgi:hypothetical protein
MADRALEIFAMPSWYLRAGRPRPRRMAQTRELGRVRTEGAATAASPAADTVVVRRSSVG